MYQMQMGDANEKELRKLIPWTLPDAHRVMAEELAAEVTDWDRYAEAWWVTQEIESRTAVRTVTTPKRIVDKRIRTLLYAISLAGLALIIFECFLGASNPAILTVGAAMLGAPAIGSPVGPQCALYGLLVAALAFGMVQEGKHLSSRTEALRTYERTAMRIHCQRVNSERIYLKLPVVKC